MEDAETRLAQGLIDTAETYNETLIENTLAVNALTNSLVGTPPNEIMMFQQAAPQTLLTPASATPATTQPISEAIASGVSQGIQQATSESGGAPVINLNQTFYIQLDDGSLSKVEARLALRSDQGLSVLDV